MKPVHPRAVIDTNVLLDFWVFDDPVARPLRAALEDGRVNALRGGDSVDELTQVILREAFDLPAEARFGALREWDRLATPVDRVFPAPIACTDPHDQKFLDLAYTARADWLVTKDKALLKLARRARRDGLLIFIPAAACAELAGAEP
ncbi:MAG: putative toxin-antitoxin system toxin component, PIN family [Burkholderiaceae bacterium]